MIANRETSDHYTWGGTCDGWVLRPGDNLLVIEERMPPGTREVRHFHARAEQFFYVLSGMLTIELDGTPQAIPAGSGLPVGRGQAHQARNDSAQEVVFLVISAPTSRGDRQEA
ncbi:Mannose-6-phosphate isomerase, cupin superfamily [Pseudooceanicola antarcticus]|uniref:Cupin domain-containing protein n=1 Tax=Pseudooceanicola antarcticus TaxID=1247613 RepID=A0A285HKZ7_9RHOB|nr:cupin domain-containing protein [Pseudooceanicola antarcticus]PJE28043.1 cupin domain-containing protein [Pseudooceanicola antarcticus]SNY36334.1 Mannose-6-phosphate isomerase, cupin superfamily [Pseudooceanicola antarcticus]